ncbi:MAG: phosphatidate cytidylyltransferase [Hydrogenovibrio sp.]|nr:phosphatidate cytidylyltransferase [Hydrogenovibrio sp.]
MLLPRVLTALILALSFGWMLFESSSQAWQALALFIAVVAAWEWCGFAKVSNSYLKALFSIGFSSVVYVMYLGLSDASLMVMTLISMGLMFTSVYRYQTSQGQAVVTQRTAVLMLGLLVMVPFFVSLIRFRDSFSPELMLLSLFIIWAIDTGAFFSGRRFGKHKLAYYVSPGKTWEGVIGGGLLALVVAYIGMLWWAPAISSPVWLMSLGMAFIGLYSVFGDLFESLLKRQVGLKDSGKLLPGHGGILDRIDSMIIAIPMFYFFWKWAL